MGTINKVFLIVLKNIIMNKEMLSVIKFDENGLVPAIVQDTQGRVLMLAYMNRDSLLKTIETGKMYYWSRSRRKLWFKGESSGNVQCVKSTFVDCDGDTLLFEVEQTGGACHLGYYSCFFRKAEDNRLVITEKKLFDPEKVYKK